MLLVRRLYYNQSGYLSCDPVSRMPNRRISASGQMSPVCLKSMIRLGFWKSIQGTKGIAITNEILRNNILTNRNSIAID